METVERYEEDLTDAAHPHPPTHAVISVGEAIEASPTRDRNAGNDFFFSGHTALVVLAAIEAAHLALPWFAVFVAVIAVGEMITVLVLWAHYTMDVLAGAFAAFLAPNVAGKLSPTVDAWLR